MSAGGEMDQAERPDAQAFVDDLQRRRQAALAGGGAARAERHRASGRLMARERIDLLVDPGSWFELGLLAEPELRREEPAYTDAVITGFGTIGGREAAVIAIDPTVLAGTTAPVNMRKQNRVAAWAGKRGLPLICLSDNDGGHTAHYLGAMSFKYAATRDEHARKEALEAFKAMT